MVPTAPAYVFEIEINDIPSQNQIGIQCGNPIEQPQQQRTFIWKPAYRKFSRPPGPSALHQDLFRALSTIGDG